MRWIVPLLWLMITCSSVAAQAAPEGAKEDPVERLLSGRCRSGSGIGILISPQHPIKGEPLRVMVVSEEPLSGATLLGKGPAGALPLKAVHRGGPPYWWFAQVDSPATGRHRFVLARLQDSSALACRRTRVLSRSPAAAPQVDKGWWPLRRRWSRIMENLYSAWVERLFDASPTERPSWTPLHKVIRDPTRNTLYNHLGTREDGPKGRKAVVVKPDCADLPFFLRAYFSWKMRLPFGYRRCNRGNSKRAATCSELNTVLSIPLTKKEETPAARFSYFIRKQVSLVHSGCGRTAPGDEETDLYPVALSRANLRPGTVYVDPYGHLLIVAKWVNQSTSSSGQMFAVDGHPDLSVGRKRFWRGAFLFSDNTKGGAGGFKAFRPLVAKDGQILPLTNEEIRKDRGSYGKYSTEQYRNGIDGFYDRMDRIINPKPLSPQKAHHERLRALFELILERVDSVKAGEDYMRKKSYKVMPMPNGPRIFETSGPWEDFSTPARDFRLLIAIDEVLKFPAKVEAAPGRFALPQGKSPATVRQEMERQLREYSNKQSFTYTRSDGSSQRLTMAQLLQRQKGLEVSYNPNDCVEKRWAAQGEELATCKRHAPEDQRRLMERFRSWFATRDRPPIR